ncbi:MAG: TMEM165/GDT1 family protein [Planctomycetes bacterium]|nr:TMEM165/GDT1 family protein [Planctomycetota bacterium]
MDGKLVAAAFSAVFLAELGDKTQLAAITLTASSGKPLSVFVGASLALVAVTALGVLFGAGAAQAMPEVWLRRGAAVLFIGLGLWMLVSCST